MAKTVFVDGLVLTPEVMNALNNPIFVQGNPENDGELPAIVDSDLSDVEGIKPTFYTFFDSLRVREGVGGLQLAFSSGSVLLEDRTSISIASGVINAIDNATNFVFVNTSGVVSVAIAFPERCLPMARVVTSGGAISSIEDLRPRWQVGPIPEKIVLDDGILTAAISQGRLTLVSGEPEPAVEVFNAGTLYFTPFTGNTISLYNTTLEAWELFEFQELSLDLSLGAANTNYDIFVYNNGGSLTLERVEWAGPKTRTIALTTQDGISVKGGQLDRRYIGTIHMKTANTTEDSNEACLIWNAQNRVAKNMIKQMLGVGAYGYIIAAWRRTFNVDDFRLQVVSGISAPFQVQTGLIKRGATISPATGIGIDSIDTNSAQIWSNAAGGSRELIQAFWQGRHFGYGWCQMLEWGGVEGVNIEFEGDYQALGNTENNGISGIIGIWEY